MKRLQCSLYTVTVFIAYIASGHITRYTRKWNVFSSLSHSLYSLVTSVPFSVYILTRERNFRLGYRTKYTQILLPAFVDVMPCVLAHMFEHFSTKWHLSRQNGHFPIKNTNITYQPAVWQSKLQNVGEIHCFCLGMGLAFALRRYYAAQVG